MTAKPLIRSLKNRSEKRSAPRPGSAPPATGTGGFADEMGFLDRVSGDGVALPGAGSNDAFVCL
jgi:hypothetical protein